jgi:capsular polysaccharide biosynthesis protein
VEIREWLRSMGDRVRLLVIIPLAAALIAALITMIAPTRYRASTTVILPGASPTSVSLTSVTAQRVADFTALVKSDGVLDKVASDLDVPRGDLGSVGVTRSGSSGVLSVSAQSTDPAQAQAIAEAVSREALRAQAQVNHDAAEARYEATRQLADDTNQTYLDAVAAADVGLYSPELLVEKGRRYNDAVDGLNAAKADGDQAGIDAAQTLVDARGELLTAVQQLKSVFDANASAQLLAQTAQQDLAQADGQLLTATSVTMPTTQAQVVDKWRALAQNVVFAAVFGFILAVGLLLLLQLVRLRSTTATATQDGPTLLPRRVAPG